MQALGDVTIDQLLAPGQQPLMKLEIEVGADNWVNLCDLDSKNYVESISGSLGGAGMTPNPVGGVLSAMLSNEDSIFHPKHPDSGYEDYLKTGRKARIWLGGTYGGVDKYWQRMIGYIDEPRFEALAQKVNLTGGDFMKLLEDTELRSPDNYWGASQAFNSWPSDGLLEDEIYAEIDAMDINNEDDNVDNWVATDCTFAHFNDVDDDDQPSGWVGRLTAVGEGWGSAKNLNVGAATAGKEYKVKFKHRGVGEVGDSVMRIQIRQASGVCKDKAYYPTNEWTDDVIYFTAKDTGAIQMWIISCVGIADLRVDQFSIWEFIPYWKRYYELLGLDPVSTGPYYITYDGVPVWQGEEDEGWYYDPEENTGEYPHPAEIVYFDINKTIVIGKQVVIYYFTATAPENAVADILVKCGLYANRDAALDAMEYTPTNITIDKIWFEPGSTCLNAIKKLCERGGANGVAYRFHFKWDGTPVFKPKPAPAETAFTFTDQKHIASFSNYQDRNEVKNRIVIEGMKQAEPVNKEETMPPELKGEAADDAEGASIDTYGERTLTIRNHLFQDQDSINAMCDKLLAEYKDPKWYSDIEIPFCAVPLELGDKISWKERLSPVLEIPQTGIIRDIKIEGFSTTYKCET